MIPVQSLHMKMHWKRVGQNMRTLYSQTNQFLNLKSNNSLLARLKEQSALLPRGTHRYSQKSLQALQDQSYKISQGILETKRTPVTLGYGFPGVLVRIKPNEQREQQLEQSKIERKREHSAHGIAQVSLTCIMIDSWNDISNMWALAPYVATCRLRMPLYFLTRLKISRAEIKQQLSTHDEARSLFIETIVQR